MLSGMAIAMQSGMSAQLGKLLQSPFAATFVVSFVTAMLIFILVSVAKIGLPSFSSIKDIPVHLWFLGSIFSAVALSTIYWLMPQIGVSNVMVGVLMGQIIMSILASHFGWFNMPVNSVSIMKLGGVMMLFAGVVLVNL